MKASIILLGLLFFNATFVSAQEIPGLSYCLLFDSKLEKNAFHDTELQDCDPMIFLLAYDPKIDSVKYKILSQGIASFVDDLEKKKKRFRNEWTFLNYVFQKTHKKYLKSYRTTEPFAGIFNNGNYNCVSGTALYACILRQLGYSPEIYETRYHIFLKVSAGDSVKCLFEATDPFEGFEHKVGKIDARIKGYLDNERSTVDKVESISAPFNSRSILQQVSLVQVAGLHYYNIAVDLVNKGNYYDAFRALKKAYILYPGSDRINDFLEFTQLKYDAELREAFADN